MSQTPQRHKKTVSEVRNVAVDMKGKLDTGELLTGTPTVVEEVTTALTLSSKVVNTTQLVINGRTVAIGEAVQFRVSGGLANQTYSIRVTVTTTSTPAQTLVENLHLSVVED